MDVFFPFVVDLDEFVVAVELVQSQASVVDRNLTDGVGDLRRTFSVPVCARFNVIDDLCADRGGWDSSLVHARIICHSDHRNSLFRFCPRLVQQLNLCDLHQSDDFRCHRHGVILCVGNGVLYVGNAGHIVNIILNAGGESGENESQRRKQCYLFHIHNIL